jgi:hypothetical protein
MEPGVRRYYLMTSLLDDQRFIKVAFLPVVVADPVDAT